MRNHHATDYLNFIDGIDTPTTGDFYDYFRIITLLLQEDADKGRWEGIIAENFTAYDVSTFFTTEMGVKLNFIHYNFEITIGARFIIEDSFGHFQVYTKLDGPLDLCQNDFKAKPCHLCEYRSICRELDSSTTKIMHSLFELKPNGKWFFDESGSEIGYVVNTESYSELYHDFCLVLDWMNPIKKLLCNSYLSYDIEKRKICKHLWELPVSSFGTLSMTDSELAPHFANFKRDPVTIEEIYNKPHGMQSEYHDEEHPF